ncbi:hypothetical protein GNI_183310 [Gregarina niphandrodes]|uniref:Uncharacterized protein n=1 Tax=Gregarina niphandrodes TaxID=110365 RepID=A0A023AY27_GRENI|nr:hypothetical protein GNI_183310 [Gregarina niphandrodes]EZG43195.1 hypothetical protein GNI_183310 [Gregarina niphandrodes]|eukprot:XP_011133548.1 hypothetical protein GNI_183310 [Gregarina niphandrodes]
MRGDCATGGQGVSPLLSVLTGVTFDVAGPGEELCGSLANERIVCDRRAGGGYGCPSPMPECTRLGFGKADRITPRLFLTIALQTVDLLAENEETLFSENQIHLVHDIHPVVKLDFARAKEYDGFQSVSDEAERVHMVQKVLSRVANEGRLTESKGGPRVSADILAPLKTAVKTMGELREALFKTYSGLEPSGDYKSFSWKGICRPMLDISQGQVTAKSTGTPVCSRCESGPVHSLPVWNGLMDATMFPQCTKWRDFVPADHRVPPNEWTVAAPGGGEFSPHALWPVRRTAGGTWADEASSMGPLVEEEAKKQGVKCSPFPWQSTWRPENPSESWPSSGTSEEAVSKAIKSDLDERAAFWRVVNLNDLLKSYRLSSEVVTQLEKDALKLVADAQTIDSCEHGRSWYIGSYPQVYVVLESSDHGKSNLRLATGPVCLTADSEKEARDRHKKFWDQVRVDAGCAN